MKSLVLFLNIIIILNSLKNQRRFWQQSLGNRIRIKRRKRRAISLIRNVPTIIPLAIRKISVITL